MSVKVISATSIICCLLPDGGSWRFVHRKNWSWLHYWHIISLGLNICWMQLSCLKFLKFVYEFIHSELFIYPCFKFLYAVWEGLWLWSSSQAARQTVAFIATITRWAACCGFSGSTLTFSLFYLWALSFWSTIIEELFCCSYSAWLYLDHNLFKVLVADINIGYEDIVNTQVRFDTADSFFHC